VKVAKVKTIAKKVNLFMKLLNDVESESDKKYEKQIPMGLD
jgi:hypothetical protein